MDYSPEGFAALYEEIERQSGALLPERCEPQDIDFTDPPYSHPKVQKEVTCGCRNDSIRFVNIYNLPKSKAGAEMRKRGGGFVTACAVCDNMGSWPRFENAVYAADPDMDPTLDNEPPEEPEG